MESKNRRRACGARLTAAALLGAVLLTGCQKAESMLAGITSEQGYDLPEIMIVAMSQTNTYEEICTDQIWSVQVDDSGQTFEQYTKDQIKSFMDEMKTMTLLAEERGVELTSEESAAMDAAAAEYVAALTPEDIAYMGVDEETAGTVFHDYCLANKLVGELTEGMDMEVSDSEAKVIDITEVRAEDQETAERILAGISEGSSLEKAASAEGLTVSERKLGRAEESEDFEYAAFGLETGQVSEVVEDNGQYCVIRCDNDYDEEATAERKEQIYEARREKAFQDIYGSFKEGIALKDSEKIWEGVSLSGEPHAVSADFFEIYKKHAGAFETPGDR